MIVFRRPATFRAIVCFLILFAAGTGHAAPNSCSDGAAAIVTVTPTFDDVSYDFRESMMTIRQLASSGGVKNSQHVEWPVGLSAGELAVRLNSQFQSKRNPYDNSICGSIRGLQIEIGFTKNIIYVAKEFPSRSCPFKEVLAHEEKHKAVDRAMLDEFAAKAQTYFEDVVKTMGVIQENDPARIEAEFNQRLNVKLNSFVEEMNATRILRQQGVDSPEEYKRVSAVCDGQVNDIVVQRLQLIEDTRKAGYDVGAPLAGN